MRLLGFQYDSRKKSFYLDGHELDCVVMNRQTFCKRYLTDYEPYRNRLIQLTMKEAKTINNLNFDFGYSYVHIINNDEERIEFHVDNLNRMIQEHQQQKEQTLSIDTIAAKAPTTSIRVTAQAQPIMIVGQDESVFAQYLFGSKPWVGPRGQRPLLPKFEGDGYMLSAFLSREFGFGRDLSAAEVVSVNTEHWGIDKILIDIQAAAMEILKSTLKPILTESPFVKYLYIAANNEGYWNSYHMSLQLEDVVDCLQVLYREFKLVFLFYHSQGHACRRNGALNAMHMSRTFGGVHASMRDTTITQEKGFLGHHSPRLKVGEDTQSFTFTAEDGGPWYLSPEQREIKRHDQPTGKIKRLERSKKLLATTL
jgi:hypothetical protein